MPVGASACLTRLPYSARLLGPDVSTRARVVGGVGSGSKIQDPIRDRLRAMNMFVTHKCEKQASAIFKFARWSLVFHTVPS